MTFAPQGEHRFREIILPFIIFTSIWGSTWIVIRDQLGVVPAQWSVAYRFLLAAAAMALLARIKGHKLRLAPGGLRVAAILGALQFCINFNAVYLAERHITSGLVATVFALLLIPNSLFAWAYLGQRPGLRFLASAAIAVAGMALLFLHELHDNPAHSSEILLGIGLTLIGMLGASASNVFQAREESQLHPLSVLLAYAMAIGAVIDAVIALILTGPPVFDPRPMYWFGLAYLAIIASALAFSLYFPVVRKIGPGKAAYSSVLVPIIAMALSTAFEGYRWTLLAAAGAGLALAGMLLALAGKGRTIVR
jgi:drug/metabolite transporter (DMT)-like permease